MSLYTSEQRAEINHIVQQWANNTLRRLKSSSKGNLSTALKTSHVYRYGLIERARFQFPRYGVFKEMGVFGGLTKKQAVEQGKLKPQPWFNPVLREDINKLVRQLGEKYADMVEIKENVMIRNTED